nr:hypothetical protein [Tanacetum cinerariifolium]
MDITRAEQIALDDALVAPTKQLKIGKILHHSILFKMNNKKHIVNLEYFREMLQICPKLPNQQFEEPPFEEAILTFLRDLGHSREIKLITDINVNKLHQPWRSFAAVIKTKNAKRGNEMYYPHFTKVIINFFMTKDQSIVRRNKINWHFSKDDQMFTTIKVVFRHEDTQLYGAILLDELTNEAIKDFESYKEYYAIVLGAEPPKTKANVKKKQARSDQAPKAPQGKRLKTSAKAAKPVKTSKAKGLTVLSKVTLIEAKQMKLATKRSLIQIHSSHTSGSGVDEGTGDERQDEEDSFDPRVQKPSHVETTDDEDNSKEIQDVNVEGDKLDEEETNEKDEGNELYRDVDGQEYSSSMSSGFVSNMINPSLDTGVDSIFNLNTESTLLVDVLVTTIAEPPLLSATTLPPPPTPLIIHLQQTSVPTPEIVPSSSLQDLPNFGSLFRFDHRLKTLENNFSEFKQTNQFVEAVSSIPGIVYSYLANKMNEPTINEQLKAEVMTCPSNESKTSHAVAANLSELELKKILIDKIESNKSIHLSNEQKNFYKALVEAYEIDKLILDTYRDTVTFKRRQDDEDKDEEPCIGSNQGPSEEEMEKNQIQPKLAKPSYSDRDWNKTLSDAHGPVQPWLSSLAQMENPRESFNELLDTPFAFTSQVPVSYDKYALWEISHWGRKRQQFYGFEANKESTCDVHSKHRIITVTKLQIVKWHNYKHLDWITIRRDDDKMYTFKDGDFNMLCIQDIDDMLLLFVQRLAFNVSL